MLSHDATNKFSAAVSLAVVNFKNLVSAATAAVIVRVNPNKCCYYYCLLLLLQQKYIHETIIINIRAYKDLILVIHFKLCMIKGRK